MRCSARLTQPRAAPRDALRRRRAAPQPRGSAALNKTLDDLPARAAQLFRDAARLRVHRHLPGARRRVHLSGGRLVRARTGRSAAVLPLASLALPGAHSGHLDAAVGGGAQQRQHRAADDAAGHAVAGGGRQIPRGVVLRRRRARAHLSRSGSRSTTSAAPTTAPSSPPMSAAS